MILYHTPACSETKCDPPRYATREVYGRGRNRHEVIRRVLVAIEGCPIGDPTIRGGVDVPWTLPEVWDAMGLDVG